MKGLLFTLILALVVGVLPAQGAVLDRVSLVSPLGGTVGIDSVLVVEAAGRTASLDSNLAVFFWLVENGAPDSVLCDSTTFGLTAIDDSIATAIAGANTLVSARTALAARLGGGANSFIAARRPLKGGRNQFEGPIGDGDSIVVSYQSSDGPDIILFRWYLPIPASTKSFGPDVRPAAVLYDPLSGTGFSEIVVSPEAVQLSIDGDRPGLGSMTLTGVSTGGGHLVSGFATPPFVRTVLGIGDTILFGYDLGDRADQVILERSLSLEADLFATTLRFGQLDVARGTYAQVIAEDQFGDLTDTTTVELFLVDRAGNRSSLQVGGIGDDIVPIGLTQAATFSVDARRPLLDGAAGDTLLPVDGDTISDGTLNNDGIIDSTSEFPNDENPLVYNLAAALDSLVIVFDGDQGAVRLVLDGAAPALDRPGLMAGIDYRLDFTEVGDESEAPEDTVSVQVAQSDGTNAVVFDQGPQTETPLLQTGVYTIRFTPTDVAGNVGPEVVRANVYVDVDAINLHDPSFLPRPQNVSARAGLGQVALSWDPVDEAEAVGHSVWRADGGGDFALVATSPPPGFFLDIGLDPSVEYRYLVRAFDSEIKMGIPSVAVGLLADGADLPPTPVVLPAEAGAGSLLKVGTPDTSAALTFHFEVALEPGFASLLAQSGPVASGPGGEAVWDAQIVLESGTAYYWRARSFDEVFYSAYTEVVEFGVSAERPGDFDGNLVVDFADFFIFADGFGTARGEAAFLEVLDLNGDDKIDLSDFFLFSDLFDTVYGGAVAKPLAFWAGEDSQTRVVFGTNAAQPFISGELTAWVQLDGASGPGDFALEMWYDAAVLLFNGAEAVAPLSGVLRQEPGRLWLAGAGVRQGEPLTRLNFTWLALPQNDPVLGIEQLFYRPGAERVRRLAQSSALALRPTQAALYAGYPNPFNASVVVPYSVAEAGPVQLGLYNMVGQKIVDLVAVSEHNPGFYQAVWDGTDSRGRIAANGVYLARLVAPGIDARVQKLVFLK